MARVAVTAMHPLLVLHQRFSAIVLSGTLFGLLGCVLTGCGQVADNPDAWYNKTVIENVTGQRPDGRLEVSNPPLNPNYTAPGSTYAAPGPTGTAPSGVTNAGVTEGDFYRSEASCGGARLGGAAGSPTVAVSLEMTECDVVRRIGSPDKIELVPNSTGDRFLVMSYVRGDRPRLYRFSNGRLIGMETLVRSSPRASRVTLPTSLGPR
jgi:hypothetical protein